MFDSGFREKSRRNRKASSEGCWFALLRSIGPRFTRDEEKKERKGAFCLSMVILFETRMWLLYWTLDRVPLFCHWILWDALRPPGLSQSCHCFKRHHFAFGFLIPPSWHWHYNSARLPRQRHVSPFLIGMYLSDPQLSDSNSFFFFLFWQFDFAWDSKMKRDGAR